MSDFWKNGILMVVSVILTFFATYYFFYEENKIKKIDVYQTFNPSFLSKPKFPKSNIKLIINGKKKTKIGLLQISFINYSNSTFTKLPVRIKLTTEDEKDFKVLTHYAVGEKDMSNLVKEIKPMVDKNNNYLFSYEIATLNRTEEKDLGFVLSILFEGNKKPQVDIVLDGISTQNFAWNHSPTQQNNLIKVIVLLVLFIILFLLLMIFIISPIMSKLEKSSNKKRSIKYAKRVYETLIEENYLNEKTEEEKKEFIQDLLYQANLKSWNKKTKIGKWMLGMITPQKDDYKI